jgi:hypothetical protein
MSTILQERSTFIAAAHAFGANAVMPQPAIHVLGGAPLLDGVTITHTTSK